MDSDVVLTNKSGAVQFPEKVAVVIRKREISVGEIAACRAWLKRYVADRRARGIDPEGMMYPDEAKAEYVADCQPGHDVIVDGRGWRRCRTCQRDAARAKRAARLRTP